MFNLNIGENGQYLNHHIWGQISPQTPWGEMSQEEWLALFNQPHL
jgi:hypothetical protein